MKEMVRQVMNMSEPLPRGAHGINVIGRSRLKWQYDLDAFRSSFERGANSDLAESIAFVPRVFFN